MLLAALSLSVAWPWLRRPSPPSPWGVGGEGETPDPQQEYEGLVAAIRRLDFDYRTGVVAEEDYLPQRQVLATEAVVLMQEMDRRASAVANLEGEVEAAMEALRAPVGQPVQADSTAGALEDEIEAAVQALRRSRRGVAIARFSAPVDRGCPACGSEVSPGDRFCATCGARLGPICQHCGRAAEPGDRFCGGCGFALREELSARPPRSPQPFAFAQGRLWGARGAGPSPFSPDPSVPDPVLTGPGPVAIVGAHRRRGGTDHQRHGPCVGAGQPATDAAHL